MSASTVRVAAAGMGEGAVRIGDARADDQVARGAEREAQRTAGISGDDAAYGRGRLERRIEGETLALFAEDALELAVAHAGFDGDRQVGGFVLDDAVETTGVQREVHPTRRHTEVELRSATDRRHGLVRGVSFGQGLRQLFGRGG